MLRERERDANGKFLFRHGLMEHPLYGVWARMNNRCTNPNYKGYHCYGARGIRMCSEWNDFNVFYEWAIANGYSEGLEIDRRDNDGNYEPENCRFVTSKVNQNNRSNNHRVTAFGETKTVAEWVDDPRCPVTYQALLARLGRHGWPVEAALTVPPHAGKPLRNRVI